MMRFSKIFLVVAEIHPPIRDTKLFNNIVHRRSWTKVTNLLHLKSAPGTVYCEELTGVAAAIFGESKKIVKFYHGVNLGIFRN